MTSRLVALHGWVFSRNFGDILMLDLAKGWLNNAATDVVVPFAREAVAGDLKVAPGRGLLSLASAQALLIPGGGAFGMRPGGGWRQRVNTARKFALPVASFGAMRRPYSLIGVGAGPFGGHIDGRAYARLFEQAALVSVRDEESLDFLRRAGLRRADVEVTADLVLNLCPEHIPEAANARAAELLSPLAISRKIIGVHFAEASTSQHYRPAHEAVLRFASDHPDIGIALIIDHPTDRAGLVSPQETAAADLKAQLGSRAHQIGYEDHWTLAALLGQLSGVITNKLHVAITSLALGKPGVAVAKHPKNRRLYRQLGIPDWCLELGAADATDITRLLNEVLGGTDVFFSIPSDIREAAARNVAMVQRMGSLAQ